MSAATLEIGRPADGVFVLNASLLNGPDLLAAGPTEALQWESILGDALNITARRGGQRDGASTNVEVGILSATFRDGPNPIEEPDKYRPGVPIRLGRVGSDLPDFTGTVRNIVCTYNKASKSTTVNFTCTDGVEALANTTRYGAIAPDGSEPWPDRIARLLVSSPVPFVNPDPIDPETVLVSHNGAAESGQWSGSWTIDGTALVYGAYDGGPVTRNLTGLTVGVLYRLRTVWETSPSPVTVAINVDATEVTKTLVPEGVAIDVAFVAQATTHTVSVTTGGGYYLILYALEFTQIEYSPWAPSILTEANLAKHLDLASTSAGVAWIVDRKGIGRIVETAGSPVLHFSDQDGPTEPTLIGYTYAVIAYDTAAIINDLTIGNHSIAGDPEAAVTVSAGPYTDITSIATYGSRSARVETAIAVDGRNGYVDGIDRFAARILGGATEPTVTISQITINATEAPEMADSIELQALIRCTWQTITRDLVIVAIEHHHTPTMHQIVLTLGDPS